MTREQILEVFAKYGFRDEHGHSLMMCVDFHELVDAATDKGKDEDMCMATTNEGPGPVHKQVCIKANAMVDEGVADLIELLNQVDRLQTLSSCQGFEEGWGREEEWGHVYFFYGDGNWLETCRFVFAVLQPALRHIEEMNFCVRNGNGDHSMAELRFRTKGMIPSIVSALKPVLT